MMVVGLTSYSKLSKLTLDKLFLNQCSFNHERRTFIECIPNTDFIGTIQSKIGIIRLYFTPKEFFIQPNRLTLFRTVSPPSRVGEVDNQDWPSHIATLKLSSCYDLPFPTILQVHNFSLYHAFKVIMHT